MRYASALGYVAIPLAFVIHLWLGAGHAWEATATFVLAGLGVIPLARSMGEATEQLSERTGPTWGGLLNATFGNAAELIIAIVAMTRGLNDVVRASLTGSILGNLLLVAGGAMVVGGWHREKQSFSKQAAETNGGLLVIAVAGMLLPAIFLFTYPGDPDLAVHEHAVSIGTSIILLIVYALGLVFTLRTHAHIFSCEPGRSPECPPGLSGVGPSWSVKRSVLTLLVASVGVAVVAELLVGSAESMAHALGWNQVFVGVILLAIIGNAAEHSTALLLARRNDMGTAMTIVFQSSLQIALFVTPFLVLLSVLLVRFHVGASQHLDLLFSPIEVAAVMLSVGIIVLLALNGQSNWFEGVLLLAMYGILAITFFYIPTSLHAGYDLHSGAAERRSP